MGTIVLEDEGTLRLESFRALQDETGTDVPERIGEPPMRTIFNTVELYAVTVESLEVDVYCSADPTVTDPEFAVTVLDVITDSETFYAGSWSSTYDTTTGWVRARTPTFGATGTIDVAAGSYLSLWVKASAGSETAIWKVGTVVVR